MKGEVLILNVRRRIDVKFLISVEKKLFVPAIANFPTPRLFFVLFRHSRKRQPVSFLPYSKTKNCTQRARIGDCRDF